MMKIVALMLVLVALGVMIVGSQPVKTPEQERAVAPRCGTCIPFQCPEAGPELCGPPPGGGE